MIAFVAKDRETPANGVILRSPKRNRATRRPSDAAIARQQPLSSATRASLSSAREDGWPAPGRTAGTKAQRLAVCVRRTRRSRNDRGRRNDRRCVVDGARCQRRGSRSAPQSAQPAANGVTRSPHWGQRLGCMSSRITELAVAAINTATAKCKKRAVRATGEIALWEPKR